jgi:hypothetical protein
MSPHSVIQSFAMFIPARETVGLSVFQCELPAYLYSHFQDDISLCPLFFKFSIVCVVDSFVIEDKSLFLCSVTEADGVISRASSTRLESV